MKWIDSLERKFNRHTIHGVVRIIVFFQAAVFVLSLVNPHFVSMLTLDPGMVKEGQVWRLVSYIFIPRLSSSWLMPDYLWLVFRLLFTWMLGDGLESVWGAFKLNFYLLIGLVTTAIGAFAFDVTFDGRLLYFSLLFAFATIDPNYEIYVMVIPLKIKWLALFSFVVLVLSTLAAPFTVQLAIVLALANYLIFFGPEIIPMLRHRKQVATRRQRFERAIAETDDVMHRCEVCKRTEITNPDLDFRVSADGHEYCVDHLPAKPPVA